MARPNSTYRYARRAAAKAARSRDKAQAPKLRVGAYMDRYAPPRKTKAPSAVVLGG